MSDTIAHFTSFGTLQRVLREVDQQIPILFPEQGMQFVPHLKDMVKQYSAHNNWDFVVVNVSKGMARQILDEMIHNHMDHKGTIIVDPTALTDEFHTFSDFKQLKAQHERLVRVNEATDDTLIIIYGLQHIDRGIELHLLMRHLRVAGLMLDLMMEEDELNIEERLQKGVLSLRDKRILLAKQQLNDILASMGKHLTAADTFSAVGGLSAQLFLLNATIHALAIDPGNPLQKHMLGILLEHLRQIPLTYANMGFDITPYQHAGLLYGLSANNPDTELIQQQEPKAVRHTPHGPEPQPE